MNQQLQKAVKKIDSLTLRERAILFFSASLGLLFLVNWLVLDPQFAKQKKLSGEIKQQQATIESIEASIQQKLKARDIDPDAAEKARLVSLKQQRAQMQNSMLDMHKGLVSPDRMASLLEDILKRNDRLQLMSLKTLPVANLADAKTGDEINQGDKTIRAAPSVSFGTPNNKQAQSADAVIYKHGVEIAVQGNYLDMISYMAELESMPWRLFWGKAALSVDEYPKATLTLTLFTLSLDEKWLNL